jgi:hypothetical protein
VVHVAQPSEVEGVGGDRLAIGGDEPGGAEFAEPFAAGVFAEPEPEVGLARAEPQVGGGGGPVAELGVQDEASRLRRRRAGTASRWSTVRWEAGCNGARRGGWRVSCTQPVVGGAWEFVGIAGAVLRQQRDDVRLASAVLDGDEFVLFQPQDRLVDAAGAAAGQARDDDKTFLAGALVGLAGGALIAAVQETLHARVSD